jgi:hypothetical protein
LQPSGVDEAPNVRGPFVERNEDTEVQYRVAKLLHDFEVDLGHVHFLVSEEAVGTVWRLPFVIHAGNLPERITGELHLEVQLE